MLQAIQNVSWKKNPRINRVCLLYSNLTSAGFTINMLWVHSHKGIVGNEIAARLAKLSTTDDPQNLQADTRVKNTNNTLPYPDMCQHLSDFCEKLWNDYYRQCLTGTDYKCLFPAIHRATSSESDSTQLFRLRSGHCRLTSHLHCLGLHPTGNCKQCQVPETVSHFLFACTTYHSERIKPKRTMESLNIDFALLSVLSDDQATKHVEEFIRTTGRQI